MALTPSSPRLPSPPPPAEIQLGPKSPSMSGASIQQQASRMEQNELDSNARRRIHPGTRATDMAAGPPLVPLNELDSAFQLQEHLAALHYHHTAGNTKAVTRETARLLAAAPPSTDRTLWLYELCRFLIAHCNSLIVGFLFDTPPCSAATCPEMRASEWQFLCAVHDAPKSCCAIDYCCHTLDWAANVVTNPKLFPSRLVSLSGGGAGGAGADGLAAAGGGDRGAALKNLINVFRRLHRIFAHAWFQHRGVFWSVEGQTGLYVFFKTVCDLNDLLPAENYKLPPEAEGLEVAAAVAAVPEIERRSLSQQQQQQQPPAAPAAQTPAARQPGQRADGEEDGYVVGRTNTRRHIRSSPSTGSAVMTVPEADEDESGAMANRFKEMQISPPETVEEEPEVAEVPVIVEHDIGERAPVEPAQDLGPPAAEARGPSGAEEKEPPVSGGEATPEETPDTSEREHEEPAHVAPTEEAPAEEGAPEELADASDEQAPGEEGAPGELADASGEQAQEKAAPGELEKGGEEGAGLAAQTSTHDFAAEDAAPVEDENKAEGPAAAAEEPAAA